MHAWHEKNILDKNFPLRIFCEQTFFFPHHWHPEIEILYMLDGEMEVSLNHRVYHLYKGDVFIIGSGEVHHFHRGDADGRVAVIQFGLAFFDTQWQTPGDQRFLSPLLQSSRKLGEEAREGAGGVYQKMRYILDAILAENAQRKEGYRLALKARLYDMAVVLLREMEAQRYSLAEKNRLANKLERLEKVFALVEENYDKELRLEDAAQASNYSIYHFARFFKEYTGTTFVEYLNGFRIKKAEELLCSTGEPITQIAYKAGFNSVKTFNRLFRNCSGCSPTQFKKSKI